MNIRGTIHRKLMAEVFAWTTTWVFHARLQKCWVYSINKQTWLQLTACTSFCKVSALVTGSDPVQALHAIAGMSAAKAVSYVYLVVQQLGMPLPVSFGAQRNAPMSCDVSGTHTFVSSWARLPMRRVFTLIEWFNTYGCLHARRNTSCEQQAAHGRPTHSSPCICAWVGESADMQARQSPPSALQAWVRTTADMQTPLLRCQCIKESAADQRQVSFIHLRII